MLVKLCALRRQTLRGETSQLLEWLSTVMTGSNGLEVIDKVTLKLLGSVVYGIESVKIVDRVERCINRAKGGVYVRGTSLITLAWIFPLRRKDPLSLTSCLSIPD